jgi:translation initiation factor 2B subunit (eIF-2B alpha/beta/delta family)
VLRAEWLTANGDLLAPVGSLPAAQLTRSAGLPVLACAPMSMYDPSTNDANGLPSELRLPAPNPGALPRIDPAVDAVPAGLIDVLLTDEGAALAPFADQLAAAESAHTRRHAAARIA